METRILTCIVFLHAYLIIRPLYRHVVCNVPVPCKANGDRKQLGAWLDSDL